MRESIIEALLIVQLVFIGAVSVVFVGAIEEQNQKITQLHYDMNLVKDENVKMQKELKNNNNIVLKVLEGEW